MSPVDVIVLLKIDRFWPLRMPDNWFAPLRDTVPVLLPPIKPALTVRPDRTSELTESLPRMAKSLIFSARAAGEFQPKAAAASSSRRAPATNPRTSRPRHAPADEPLGNSTAAEPTTPQPVANDQPVEGRIDPSERSGVSHLSSDSDQRAQPVRRRSSPEPRAQA